MKTTAEVVQRCVSMGERKAQPVYAAVCGENGERVKVTNVMCGRARVREDFYFFASFDSELIEELRSAYVYLFHYP